MFKNDPLFVEYDKNRFDAYKLYGIADGQYGDYLDKALSATYNTNSVKSDIDRYANPIGMVVSGPTSNIAGRFRRYLSGNNDDFLPPNQMKYGSTVQGYKTLKPPSSKDLATGWATDATDDLLYPW
jgi:hypothetical protein